MNYFSKKILSLFLLFSLILCMLPNVAFANSTNVNTVEAPMKESMMKAELLEKGFTANEVEKFSRDLPEIYDIITDNNLSEEQLANLKHTFENIRDIHDIDETPVYNVSENGIVDLGDHKNIVPHPEYLKKPELSLRNSNTIRSSSAQSSGVHMMTYSNPTYKFYKVTGYVDLPTVSIKHNPGATYPYNSRPYVMYGAYGNGGGFDAGLVYYQETASWRLFRNVLGSGWSEKNISLNGNTAYLWMELNGSSSLIKVIDPTSWKEIGSLTIPAPASFTKNPSNVNITREVALAQFSRTNNGDYLKNAHWNQVHYYRNSDGFHTVASPEYVLSNIVGRYSYSSSMPKYLIGDTLADKSKVTITSQSNYSAEWVNIILN